MRREVFSNIAIDLKLDNVYRRLGFWSDKTKLSDKQRSEIDLMAYECLDFLNFKAVAVRQAIVDRGDDFIKVENGQVYKSKNLSSVFEHVEELLFMGATAGSRIIDELYSLSADNLTKATVYNAVAGEMVDDVFDWLMAFYSRQLRREMLSVTRNRYSAGYGDLSIEQQKDIFELLKFDELGVSLTKSFMLEPEKSVTAIAGIYKKNKQGNLC